MFKLDAGQSEVTNRPDTLTVLEKTYLSYGGSCYELNDKDKFRLTYCGNLHITMSEGRIVKMKQR
jgi:hypothetical protein